VVKLSFYLDESVHIAVANGLKRREVDAISAKDAGQAGMTELTS